MAQDGSLANLYDDGLNAKVAKITAHNAEKHQTAITKTVHKESKTIHTSHAINAHAQHNKMVNTQNRNSQSSSHNTIANNYVANNMASMSADNVRNSAIGMQTASGNIIAIRTSRSCMQSVRISQLSKNNNSVLLGLVGK